jgi:hypothetical protein
MAGKFVLKKSSNGKYHFNLGPVLGGLFVTELSTIAAGAVLLAAMVAVELRSRAPIVDLPLLRNRLFRSGNGVMVLASIAFLGTLYAISLYFQDGRGLLALLGPQTSLWWARLLMLTLGLSMAQVFVPVQAASFATISPRRPAGPPRCSTRSASSAGRSAWPC